MDHESYDFPEAIRYLAREIWDPTRRNQSKTRNPSWPSGSGRPSIKSLNLPGNILKNSYSRPKKGQISGLQYFEERGFRTKTIENFGLGYASQATDSLISEALKAGFTKEILQRAGLMTQNDGDFFRHRVIFPIFNISGKVIAFAGRQLTTSKAQP